MKNPAITVGWWCQQLQQQNYWRCCCKGLGKVKNVGNSGGKSEKCILSQIASFLCQFCCTFLDCSSFSLGFFR